MTVNFVATLRIGSAPINPTEQVAPGNPQPTSAEIPPSQWATTAADPVLCKTIRFLDQVDIGNVNAARPVGNGTAQRRGIIVDDATATILNRQIGRANFTLHRIGSPQGNVTCRIWDSFGNVKVTLTRTIASYPTGTSS